MSRREARPILDICRDVVAGSLRTHEAGLRTRRFIFGFIAVQIQGALALVLVLHLLVAFAMAGWGLAITTAFLFWIIVRSYAGSDIERTSILSGQRAADVRMGRLALGFTALTIQATLATMLVLQMTVNQSIAGWALGMTTFFFLVVVAMSYAGSDTERTFGNMEMIDAR